MKHILLILLTALSFSAIGQTVPMTNNVPWYEYSKKLSVGKFMLKSSGEYDTSFTIPSNTASITLDTIAADKTVTFTDGTAYDKGVTMYVQNANNSAFVWNVAGNVKEADGTVISNLPRGLHIFYWNSNAWIRLSTSGGSSPTVDTLTFTSPLVQLDKNVSLDFDAFPQDTIGVVEHNDSLFNILYSHTGVRDSTFIVLLSAGGGGYWDGLFGGTIPFSTNTTISGSPYNAYIFTGSSPATLTLPSIASSANRVFFIKNQGSATLTVASAGAGEIFTSSFVSSFTMAVGAGYIIANDGDYWNLYAEGGGGGSGTVTSVATGYGLSGGPITATGTILADTTNQLASKLRLYKVADSLALALAPNLSVYNSGSSGSRLSFVNSDTLWIKKIKAGSGISLTDGSDSTVSIAVTGGGGWNLTGNSISAGDSIFGTTSNHAVRFQTNAIDRGTITRDGKLVWGAQQEPEPGAWKIQVAGSIYATDSLALVKNRGGSQAVTMWSPAANQFTIKVNATSYTFNSGVLQTTAGYATSYLRSPIYYVDGTTGTYTTSGTPSNTSISTVHTFTNGTPSASTGTAAQTLVYMNRITNRGTIPTYDGTETALKINFTVTGTDPTDLRAIDVQKGRTILRGVSTNLVAKTTTYTATDDDHTITGDATSAGFTITLPTAVGRTGQEFVFKKIDSGGNTVTIGTTSSQTIDGSTTYTGLSAQWKYVKVQSNGANWLIVANN